jgi:ribonuclease P protein component
MSFTFGRHEHLKSRKSISLLVNSGLSFLKFPIKVRWINAPEWQIVPVVCTFSVPKRNFKKAVQRNYIKRIMREAYRLNKQPLFEYLIEKNVKIQVLFTFIDNEIPTYQLVESKIILTLQSLIELNETCADGHINLPC